MTEDAKTIHISLAIGLLEIVRYEENRINHKSARAIAVGKLIDHSLKVVDYYRVNSWSGDKLSLASDTLDEVEKLITERFNGVV